ncbi:MAG TPA: hypothetical protein VLB82_07490 [Thermodesulfobacteriota bacterium]|nr:hypothetical protein [Thermodesulfobacteriota bacterium]
MLDRIRNILYVLFGIGVMTFAFHLFFESQWFTATVIVVLMIVLMNLWMDITRGL